MTPYIFHKAVRMIETATLIHAPAVRRWLDLLYMRLEPNWLDAHDRAYLERLFAEKFD